MRQGHCKYKYYFIILICLFLVGCSIKNLSLDNTIEKSNQIENNVVTEHKEIIEGPKKKKVEKSIQAITVSAVGDILIHDRVYNDARTENGYDFKPMLRAVKKHLNDTTITFANQETMIGGEKIGLSTYPTFN